MRQWFALDGGDLKPLGDCGDFQAADEIATDLGMELNWLVSPEMAQDWVNVLASRGITAVNERLRAENERVEEALADTFGAAVAQADLVLENELLREALRSLVEGEGKLGCIHSRKLAKAILEDNKDEG